MSLSCLQAGKYWPEVCAVIGRPELADRRALRRRRRRSWRTPPRPSSSSREVFAAAHRSTSGASGSADFSGQWAWCRTRSRPRPTRRPSPTATSQDCETADGTPFKLAAAPVQFDERAGRARAGRPSSTSTATRSSPTLGLDWDTIVDLKVRGVVA